jgi:hypothetical protein
MFLLWDDRPGFALREQLVKLQLHTVSSPFAPERRISRFQGSRLYLSLVWVGGLINVIIFYSGALYRLCIRDVYIA